MLTTKQRECLQKILMEAPLVYPTVKRVVKPYSTLAEQKAYSIGGTRFGQWATVERFRALKANMIQIDISQQLLKLNDESYLEVSVPVMGLVDLMKRDGPQRAQSFATVMAVNGLGNTSDCPIPADFVKVTDIVGNQYEVMINNRGEMTLPAEGTGLFSLVSHVTFCYSAERILTGKGMTSLPSHLCKKQRLYLLAPPENKTRFTCHISVCEYRTNGQRQVTCIQPVNVAYQDLHIDKDCTEVKVSPVSLPFPGMLQVEIGVKLLGSFLANKQLTATVWLQSVDKDKFQFISLPGIEEALFNRGWKKISTDRNVFSKSFGLSPRVLAQLIRVWFSQYDLKQRVLLGDTLGLSNQDGYNNFALFPEALEYFYDRMLYDLMHQHLSFDFILDRVPKARIMNASLGEITARGHDADVLKALSHSLAAGRFDCLRNLFYYPGAKATLSDFFHVSYANPMQPGTLPMATLIVTQDNHAMHEIVETLQERPGADTHQSSLNHLEDLLRDCQQPIQVAKENPPAKRIRPKR